MKKLLAVTLTLLAGAMLSSSADRRNFWVLNNTGREITRFYVAIHGSGTTWSSDVLGRSTLPNAGGTVVYFTDSNYNNCMYDFRVTYSDGSYDDYLKGRNLCQTHAVQFNSGTNDVF
jgi:hypothetical protein